MVKYFGFITLTGAAMVIAVLGVIGLAAQHWKVILWALSLGGSFWGAKAVEGLALFIFFWCLLVAVWKGKRLKVTIPLAFVIAVLGALASLALWLLAGCAAAGTFAKFSELSIFQKLAEIATSIYAVGFLSPFAFLIAMLSPDEE